MESRAALSLQQPAERAPRPSGEPPRRLSRLQGLRPVGAIASGLLLYLAFPPVDLPWLALPAVALLALVCRGTTARRGALLRAAVAAAP